ncbi:MAG: L-fucose/L-arabinose isomerase family protein [Candidatus Hydrogenedentes bacterium]|nr:L-fucose/L-arabinose isomerase family protein [Candidatus Hydrogenedentota bacterium]
MKSLPPIKPALRARVGLYSIGHPHYWVQFEGLLDRLLGYGQFIERQIEAWAEVSNFGMVDSEEQGHRAGDYFNEHNADLVLCHAATYAMSAFVLPVVQICRKPAIVLNLQPAERMNYARTATGEWLAHCCACCVPEISNAFARAGIAFHVVSGLLGLENQPEGAIAHEKTHAHPDAIAAWKEIEEWVRAAGVVRTLQHGRLGFLGHTYPGMLDMYSDFTMIQAQTGLHVATLEMCDLARLLPTVTTDEKATKLHEVEDTFIISEDSPADPLAKRPKPEQLDWACTVAVAQEKLVREFNLDALAYYYRGAPGNENERLQEAFILGHSLLTARGIPCSGEGDAKTAIAMKICDILGVGGSYSEMVATDFVDQTILMGHDGPFHIAISDQKPILRGMGLYHGKWGRGVSVEAKVKTGPVTTLGVTQTRDGRLKMIVNQGEATGGEILRIGNTMTPIRFAMKPREFMDAWFACGPTHHFAMSVGHNARLFQKVATLLDWPFETVSL